METKSFRNNFGKNDSKIGHKTIFEIFFLIFFQNFLK